MCMHVKTGKTLKFVLSTASMAQYNFVDTKSVHYRNKSEHYRGKFFLTNYDASQVFKGIQGHYNKNC